MSFQALKHFTACSSASDDPQPIIQAEEQNSDYESGVVLFGKEWWRIRTARITPTKQGAFVAVWKRDGGGSTRPFTAGESLSGLMVFVEERGRFGVFRFSPSYLISLGYVTSEFHPGKRGFRVYPAWCSDLNPQASRTQRAQASAFVELPPRSVPWTETGRTD
ncbi:MepB family protein [Paenarthrobacter sp. CAP02]|uniref:MepB family protein n=1 Tax=Paenarthrobacter sp. CAP02 TaxID=3158144 RepID=UPI0032DBA756